MNLVKTHIIIFLQAEYMLTGEVLYEKSNEEKLI